MTTLASYHSTGAGTLLRVGTAGLVTFALSKIPFSQRVQTAPLSAPNPLVSGEPQVVQPEQHSMAPVAIGILVAMVFIVVLVNK